MKTIQEKIARLAEKLISRGEDMQAVAFALLSAGVSTMRDGTGRTLNQVVVQSDSPGQVSITVPEPGHKAMIVPEKVDGHVLRLESLVEAVRASAQQFLAYEQAHRAKGNADADAKADVNRAMAAMCYRAIGTDVPEQNGYMLGLFPVADTPAAFKHAIDTLVENGYERGVEHGDMMTGLLNSAFDIGEDNGWRKGTRIVLGRASFGSFEYHMVAPTTPRGQEVVVRPDFRPQESDSEDQAPETSLGAVRLSSAPLDRQEVVDWLDLKIAGAKKAGMIDTVNVLQGLQGDLAQHLEAAPIDFQEALQGFYVDCHARNVTAGWWSDIKTNKPKKRSVGELFMLFVTELWEAYDAYVNNQADDKLPQYPGIGVELGDLQIRLADFAGALIEGRIVACSGVGNPGDLMFCEVGEIARRYEAIRKTPEAVGEEEMGEPLEPMDVAEMVFAKLEYNATREDHKVENRLKDDGKRT